MSELPSEHVNGHGDKFVAFSEGSFSWLFIERPTIDKCLSELYSREVKLLDVGCGAGRVTNHLIGHGVLAENIIGIDADSEMVDHFAANNPDAQVVRASASALPIRSGSVDVVLSNMLLHQLDDKGLENFFAETSRVLVTDGVCLFIDTNPYSSEDRAEHIGQWIAEKTPWGTEIPAFIHDLKWLLNNKVKELGLNIVSAGEPEIMLEGAQIDPKEYERYSQGNLRYMAKLVKG